MDRATKRHLVIVGGDLAQLMDLAAAAGREFATTSLIHTRDVLARASDRASRRHFVVLCLDSESELPASFDERRTVFVVAANPPPLRRRGLLVLARAEAPAELVSALRSLQRAPKGPPRTHAAGRAAHARVMGRTAAKVRARGRL